VNRSLAINVMQDSIESKLGYSFRNPELLELALTHASCSHEQKARLPHNERLEFLGDAVLQLVISEYLYSKYPEAAEGWLTKTRAHLVNRSSLLEIAKMLDVGSYLRLGEAEISQGGRERASNLANAVEAIIGALFLDGSLEAARAFILKTFQTKLEGLGATPQIENTKGTLQEILHSKGESAVYRIISESGPAHKKKFEAVVEINGKTMGTGIGESKKEAEIKAASAALEKLSSLQN
jgi:ribonuclease-3